MPDSITPVAAQIKGPDINQGLGTISGLLGLRQQQQALQTGQYQQASAQAESQQAQQKNAEMQRAQAVALQGAQSGKYTKSDGTLDRMRMADDISMVAPTYGSQYAGQLLSQANEVVANQQALQTLGDDQRKRIGGSLQALASNPNLSHSDVVNWADQELGVNNDPGTRRLILS